MPTSAKRPASRSPNGERRSKRQLTSSPPEEGEVDDDQSALPSSLAPKPITFKTKIQVPFPFKTRDAPPAPLARNVFEQHDSKRSNDDERRSRDADQKRTAPRTGGDHWEATSTSSRHARNPRDRRSPSPPRRSNSPYPERHRLPHPHSPPSPPRWHNDRGRRHDTYDGYGEHDRYRPRDDSRAWTRRDDRERYYDGYARPSYGSPHHYRPMSPGHDNYRPVSPRPSTRTASPWPPLSPPRTRAHTPPLAQPPQPASEPPPPPSPDMRLIPRDRPLPPPPSCLPPRPPAPLEIHSPPAMVHPPPPEVRKETVRIMRKPPPRRRPQKDEEISYGRVFKGCGNQAEYQATTKLGEGTFGEVHKAIHMATGRPVALKRILMHNEKEGMPVTALREIKILKALNHPCIVNILDMFVVRSTDKDPLSVYMVFPYMDHDLAGLLENERVKLQPSHIKLYMKQLLEGTEYMHRNHILHRDMKAANLLINNAGTLLIADFGLARAFDSGDNPKKERKYTNCVVTRWYRPPELLLGARQYGGEVDMWGIGCVLGEMFMRRPILPGTSDLDQLERIWGLCGSPNQHNWANFDMLPGCEGVKRFGEHPRRLGSTFEHIGKETCDLLDKLLICNPRERITAAQALDHDYFWTDPMPADPKTLPTYEASHEFDKRGHRQQQHYHQQQQQQQKHAGGPPHMDPHRQYRAPPPGAVPPDPNRFINPNYQGSRNWQQNRPPPTRNGAPPRLGPGPGHPGGGGRMGPYPPRRDGHEPRNGGGMGGRPPGLPARPLAPQGISHGPGMPQGRPTGGTGGGETLNYG